MKKRETIKRKEEFGSIIKTGKVLKSSFFSIYYKDNNTMKPNFGIAVSKKLGNAVIRNKLKRRYRNIIDNNKLLFSNKYNYIIMIRKASLYSSFMEINNSMKDFLEKVKHEKI